MSDSYPPSMQRPRLMQLIQALGGQWKSVCRDDNGDWHILGKLGHIYAVPGSLDEPNREGYLIYCTYPGSVRSWTFTKREMRFCTLTQDGDDEGIFFMSFLPTEKQAQVIRGRIGLRKRKLLSDEERARLQRFAFSPAKKAS